MIKKRQNFIAKKQAKIFNQMNLSPLPGQIVLQIDFSKNAALVPQDEIQSSHWNHEQVTVFPAVAWTKDHTLSYAVISDMREHDKVAAAKFIDTIIDDVKSKVQVNEVHIFSDGATQHFKSRFMMAYLSSIPHRKEISAIWHFFATSHGKGAVDGIRGNVKRKVRREILSRSAIVNTAAEFAVVARNTANKTIVIFLTEKDIRKEEPVYKQLWKDPKLKGIRAIHYVKARCYGTVEVAQYSQRPTCETQVMFELSSEERDAINVPQRENQIVLPYDVELEINGENVDA